MQTITVKSQSQGRNRRSRLLFTLATVIYLIALYSLLTSFYVFEIRRSNVQTEVNQPEIFSVDKITTELKGDGFRRLVCQFAKFPCG